MRLTIAPEKDSLPGLTIQFASTRRGSSPGLTLREVRSSGCGFMNMPVRGWFTPTGFLFWS